MIKTNKKTGQKVEIPDNTPPEMVGKAIQAALARQSANESGVEFESKNPLLGFAAGAVNKSRELPQAALRFLANKGVPFAQKEIANIDKFNANHQKLPGERAGEVVGDIGTTAALTAATGGAGIVAPALTMAAQHQAQNYARGEEVSPGQAALDAGLGIALPYAGKGVGIGGKAVGKRILENVVKPVGKYAGVDLTPVLERSRGIFKYLESLGKVEGKTKKPISGMVKRTSDDVAAEAKNRLAMMEKGGVTGDFPAAAQSAEVSITGRAPELGQRGLIPGERDAALKAAEAWQGTKPNLNAKELQGLIQKSDDVAYQAAKDINLAPQQTYSRELGRALRGQREAGVQGAASAGRLSPEELLGYNESQEALRGLKPALDAIAYRAAKPNYSGSAIKNIPLGVGPLLDLAVTRPGTANLAYDIGRAASNPHARYLGKKTLDLARAAMFSPGDN